MTQDEIISLVAEIYDELEIDDLGFDVFDVCRRLHIDVTPYSRYKSDPRYPNLLKRSEDGVGYFDTRVGRARILYNDEIYPSERIVFTICHEIGHFCLQYWTLKSYLSTDVKEREATLFALIFYTPLVILKYLNLTTPRKIREKLHISADLAERTYERLDARYGTGQYECGEPENRLLWVFKRNRQEHGIK